MIIIKYEIIIFDADETLFDFKKSEKKAFENTIIDFGIDTCWFNPAMDLNDAGIKPTYTISDLMEFKEILKN